MYAWLVLWSACLVAICGAARAADWYTGEGAPPLRGPFVVDPLPPPSYRFGAAIDAAVSGASIESLHLALIGTIAPFTGLDQSGVRLRVTGVVGEYGYVASQPKIGQVRGSQEQGSVSAGYEWISPTTSIAGFVGVEGRDDVLTPHDPTNPVAGTAFGLRSEFDFYTRPTPLSMVAGEVTYSTTHNAWYGALRLGLMPIPGSAYVGPEFIALGDDFYRQWRVGAHATGFGFGGLEFGLSAGFLEDRVRGAGAYGILATRARI